MFSSAFVRSLVCLFVCYQWAYYAKTILKRFSQEIGGKMAHEPQKKPIDFGGNSDHVTLGKD